MRQISGSGNPHLVAYGPVKIGGLHWTLGTQIRESEATLFSLGSKETDRGARTPPLRLDYAWAGRPCHGLGAVACFFEEAFEFAAADGVLEFPQGFGFDLADAFA